MICTESEVIDLTNDNDFDENILVNSDKSPKERKKGNDVSVSDWKFSNPNRGKRANSSKGINSTKSKKILGKSNRDGVSQTIDFQHIPENSLENTKICNVILSPTNGKSKPSDSNTDNYALSEVFYINDHSAHLTDKVINSTALKHVVAFPTVNDDQEKYINISNTSSGYRMDASTEPIVYASQRHTVNSNHNPRTITIFEELDYEKGGKVDNSPSLRYEDRENKTRSQSSVLSKNSSLRKKNTINEIIKEHHGNLDDKLQAQNSHNAISIRKEKLNHSNKGNQPHELISSSSLVNGGNINEGNQQKQQLSSEENQLSIRSSRVRRSTLSRFDSTEFVTDVDSSDSELEPSEIETSHHSSNSNNNNNMKKRKRPVSSTSSSSAVRDRGSKRSSRNPNVVYKAESEYGSDDEADVDGDDEGDVIKGYIGVKRVMKGIVQGTDRFRSTVRYRDHVVHVPGDHSTEVEAALAHDELALRKFGPQPDLPTNFRRKAKFLNQYAYGQIDVKRASSGADIPKKSKSDLLKRPADAKSILFSNRKSNSWWLEKLYLKELQNK